MASTSIYEPLDPLRREIRLLDITSRSASEAIHCELHTFDLDDEPKYKALSYTGGENKDHERIRVNGQGFMIRPNLFSFLQVYRSREDRGLIWIDQLCIDQDSTEEKNHQVGMMDHVYRGAEETLIWLGRGPCEGQALAEMLQAQAAIANGRSVDEIRKCFRKKGNGAKKAILALFNASYWQRLWVVQEVVLSAKCVLCCGRSEMLFQDLFETIESHSESNPHLLFELLGMSDDVRRTPIDYFCWLVASLEIYPNSSDTSTLFETVTTFVGGSVCEDARDKIYGMQSVPPAELRLTVDYRSPVRAVYLNAIELWHARHPPSYFISFLCDCIRLAEGMSLTKISPTMSPFEYAQSEFNPYLSLREQRHVQVSQEDWCTLHELKDFLNTRILKDDDDTESSG